ncbi:MAG: 50S ribosomal protein L4 [Candidatus Peregrinibacteria bacterium]|nr:50S ribosomal protein L4 [Candidatus Peregrinibacteria bacterium]MCB9807745.1 50S ribosomal protein L4 [Candidatus Peribacteria bacterium]
MTIDVYTSKGTKDGTANLPKTLFEANINEGLMHQAVVRAQSNVRNTVAHAKSRGEIQGSTRKLFQQKGTGRARRGSVRSPVLRGGNKAFGPQKIANFVKDMPQKMRRAALFSALSYQAKNGAIIGLKDYPEAIKTKDARTMLEKMPVDIGRKILIVTPGRHDELSLSVRNIPGVRTVMAQYLNPMDILGSRHIIFMVDALKKAEEVFGKEAKEAKESKEAKVSSASSESSVSSASSRKKSSTSSK